jgi:hypothetical protein
LSALLLWSPIHLLSIFTLVTLPLGVWMAHRHRVADHRRIMILIFSGALVIAGLFTLDARRRVWALARPEIALSLTGFVSGSGARGRGCRGGFPGCGEQRRGPRKYLEKRREKPVARIGWGWYGGHRYAI